MAAKTIRQKVDGEKDIHAVPKYSSTDYMRKGENIFTIKTTAVTTLIVIKLTSLIADNQALCATWCNALWSNAILHEVFFQKCLIKSLDITSSI